MLNTSYTQTLLTQNNTILLCIILLTLILLVLQLLQIFMLLFLRLLLLVLLFFVKLERGLFLWYLLNLNFRLGSMWLRVINLHFLRTLNNSIQIILTFNIIIIIIMCICIIIIVYFFISRWFIWLVIWNWSVRFVFIKFLLKFLEETTDIWVIWSFFLCNLSTLTSILSARYLLAIRINYICLCLSMISTLLSYLYSISICILILGWRNSFLKTIIKICTIMRI